MSAESWKKEFYPITAQRCSKKKAVEHSLQKWTGALKKNLKKHGLTAVPINFDSNTCALCVRYADLDFTGDGDGDVCGPCPLYMHLGNRCFYDSWLDVYNEDGTYPYDYWKDKRDPKPMIKALRATLKKEPKKA